MDTIKGGFVIRFFKSNTFAIILTIMFIIGIYYSYGAYISYQSSKEKLETATVRLKLMNDQKLEIEKKQRSIRRAKQFMEKAKSLGLEKSQWVNYEVDIHEPVTFSEMEIIINQCTNTATYYFKPILLEIKTDLDSAMKEATFKNKTISDEKKVDVVLLLKGNFVARNK